MTWESEKLENIVDFETGKLNANAAKKDGKYPFFTCSQETLKIDKYAFDKEAILLSGNNAKGIYSVKYYNGKFNAYQRTYVIQIKNKNLVFYDFLLFALTLNLERLRMFSIGTSTKYLTLGILKNFEVTLPPLEEQRKIVGVLSLVQEAIRQQEQLITITTELKKATMQKLFTEGTRGEPQKMTEIGLIPESWDVIHCSELCTKITVGVVVKPASYYVESGIPAFRSFNIREDQLFTNELVYFSPEDNNSKLAKSKIYAGDVLIIRTGYPGTSCVVPKQYDGANCIDIVIARPKSTISSHFLSRFFNSPVGKSQALSAKHGLAQQHLNVGAVKNVIVPKPQTLEEQNEVVRILEEVDRKIRICQAKKTLLQDLFQTLLHQLMTAKIRVDDLDLSALNLELQGGKQDALV